MKQDKRPSRPPALMTPKEILERFPILQTKFGWNAQTIGTLCKAFGLVDRHSRSGRRALIPVHHVKRLVRFYNEGMRDKMVDLDQLE